MATIQWTKSHFEQLAALRTRSLDSEELLLLSMIDDALAVKTDLLTKAVLLNRQSSEHSHPRINPSILVNSVLLKPVSDLCNLRCTYCYEGIKNQRTVHRRMAYDTLEQIIEQILSRSSGPILFSWHGGEPLLAGLHFFKKGLAFQRRHYVNHCPVTNTVQTNGTLLNKQWIQFFKENHFCIGLSLDGKPLLHDRYRVDSLGRGTFSKVAAGIRMLQEEEMPFGVISTVSSYRQGDAKEMLETFIRLGIRQFNVQPNVGYSFKEGMAPTHPKQYSDFVIELFESWLQTGNREVQISLFSDIARALVFGIPGTCYLAGSCDRIIAFEANGDAVPCTRPFDRTESLFGNIRSDSIIDICSGEKYKQFYRKDFESQQRSSACRWYGMCHNDCPSHRVENGERKISAGGYYCSCQSGIEGGYSAIFSHVTSRIERSLFESTVVV